MNVLLFVPKRSSSCSLQNIPVNINRIAGYKFNVGGLGIVERKKKGRKKDEFDDTTNVNAASFLSSSKCMCNPKPAIPKTTASFLWWTPWTCTDKPAGTYVPQRQALGLKIYSCELWKLWGKCLWPRCGFVNHLILILGEDWGLVGKNWPIQVRPIYLMSGLQAYFPWKRMTCVIAAPMTAKLIAFDMAYRMLKWTLL